MQILKVEITNYISLSKSMSLRDTLVENERAASEPLIFVMVTRCVIFSAIIFFIAGPKTGTTSVTRNSAVG